MVILFVCLLFQPFSFGCAFKRREYWMEVYPSEKCQILTIPNRIFVHQNLDYNRLKPTKFIKIDFNRLKNRRNQVWSYLESDFNQNYPSFLDFRSIKINFL